MVEKRFTMQTLTKSKSGFINIRQSKVQNRDTRDKK